MGAYLSEPVLEKHSEDGQNESLGYGSSSMQGWRVSQEVHTSLLLAPSFQFSFPLQYRNPIPNFLLLHPSPLQDAHNSILDFEAGKSLFAVYDGHGGHEVRGCSYSFSFSS